MKNARSVLALACPLTLLGLQTVCSQAFGSESSNGSSFSLPVDAPALRTALITGSSAGDDAEFWECIVGDGGAVLQYRLLADGTGVEHDLANPAVPSTFTWETNSATTATTLVDASGIQNDLSSFSFSDRNNMSLLVGQSLPLACVRQGVEEGDGAVAGLQEKPVQGVAEDNSAAEASFASERRAVGQIEPGVVSEQNRPDASYTYLESSSVGFPAMIVQTAEVAYFFPNGYTVYCANWDPRYLDPTPGSVGQAIEGCDVKKGKPEGSLNKGFKTGQNIEINFGNVSASGSDIGGSTGSRMSGSTLLMSRHGLIAIGTYNAFSVASGGNGAGGGNKRRELIGNYVLDGHLITIVTTSGEKLVGFVSWESDSGSSQIDHVYINGEHFWNRKK